MEEFETESGPNTLVTAVAAGAVMLVASVIAGKVATKIYRKFEKK